mmetsp:Transcript_18402/g.31284  ORF Transcript_18402/g.31284 Transcript_18402/m.31284 type:complete len:226 (+) Transcript_18402:804-1481(+)
MFQPKVPRRQAFLEGCDEAAGCRVHVDTDLQPFLRVEFFQDSIDLPNRIILAPVVVAHDADYSDGLLINEILDLGRVQGKGLVTGLHKSWLDVHVLEQLLPGCLKHRRNHQVGINASDFVFALVELLGIPLPPSKLQGQARQQTRLGGAHGAGARIAAVLLEVVGLGAVPGFGDHVEGVVMHAERLGVHRLIRQVHLQPHQRHLLFFWLKDHVDVAAGVQTFGEV